MARCKSYLDCVGSQQQANAIAKQLIALMAERGWNLRKKYTANEGSVYLQFEQPGDDGLYSGKVRIADHEDQSSNHAAPEVEILYGPKYEAPDLVGAADAIASGEQGQF